MFSLIFIAIIVALLLAGGAYLYLRSKGIDPNDPKAAKAASFFF